MNHCRVLQRLPKIGVRLRAHELGRRGPVPGIRVRADDALGRLVGLTHEPPMPPGAHEVLVETLEVLDDGQPIHDHEPRDDVRMVQRGAQGDQ